MRRRGLHIRDGILGIFYGQAIYVNYVYESQLRDGTCSDARRPFYFSLLEAINHPERVRSCARMLDISESPGNMRD